VNAFSAAAAEPYRGSWSRDDRALCGAGSDPLRHGSTIERSTRRFRARLAGVAEIQTGMSAITSGCRTAPSPS
jgi:hypothetical protein